MQYCAVLSPARLETRRIAEILAKNNFHLVSKAPESSYNSRDIAIHLFVDFATWGTVLSSYEVYRVVGPDKRWSLLRFENTPRWVKWRYYCQGGGLIVIELIKHYLNKIREHVARW